MRLSTKRSENLTQERWSVGDDETQIGASETHPPNSPQKRAL
jgi:hypothetical protein